MRPGVVIERMIQRSGKRRTTISYELGKSESWAQNVSRPTRDPKLSTVADVASVTGHKVAILDAESGDVVGIVDAPESGSAMDRGRSDSAESD